MTTAKGAAVAVATLLGAVACVQQSGPGVDLAATARTVHVCVHPDKGHSQQLPEPLSTELRRLLAKPDAADSGDPRLTRLAFNPS